MDRSLCGYESISYLDWPTQVRTLQHDKLQTKWVDSESLQVNHVYKYNNMSVYTCQGLDRLRERVDLLCVHRPLVALGVLDFARVYVVVKLLEGVPTGHPFAVVLEGVMKVEYHCSEVCE